MSDPLHILYLIDQLAFRAGTEKHLFALSKGMASKGHRVSVFSLLDGEFAQNFKGRENERIFYRCLNVKRAYDLRGLTAMKYLAGFISKNKVDVLQSFHTGSDLMAPVAAKLSRTDVAVVSSRRDLGFTKSPRHIYAQRVINRYVDCILANSTAVKQAIIEQEGFSEDRIEIIYNGIDLESYQKEYKRPSFLDPIYAKCNKPFIVGNVGNLKEVKGHRFLINVASELCPRYPYLFFIVAGDGPLKNELQSYCKVSGVDGNFFFIGNIEEIPALMKHIHLYVQPSKSEGFSNSIIEAMAAGCPIIATNVGGNLDAIRVGENGIFVNYNDIDLLADGIAIFIDNSNEANLMGKNNKKRAMDIFSLEAMASNYDSFYKHIKVVISN